MRDAYRQQRAERAAEDAADIADALECGIAAIARNVGERMTQLVRDCDGEWAGAEMGAADVQALVQELLLELVIIPDPLDAADDANGGDDDEWAEDRRGE